MTGLGPMFTVARGKDAALWFCRWLHKHNNSLHGPFLHHICMHIRALVEELEQQQDPRDAFYTVFGIVEGQASAQASAHSGGSKTGLHAATCRLRPLSLLHLHRLTITTRVFPFYTPATALATKRLSWLSPRGHPDSKVEAKVSHELFPQVFVLSWKRDRRACVIAVDTLRERERARETDGELCGSKPWRGNLIYYHQKQN